MGEAILPNMLMGSDIRYMIVRGTTSANGPLSVPLSETYAAALGYIHEPSKPFVAPRGTNVNANIGVGITFTFSETNFSVKATAYDSNINMYYLATPFLVIFFK